MAQEHVLFPSGDIQLEGRLHTPAEGSGPFPGVVLCHPHPLYGGDMENNVVMTMGQGLNSQGVAVLRFNFRGVGASEGAHDGGKGEQEDVLAALEALRGSDGIDQGRIGLAGYSFGASMTLAAGPRDPGVEALAVVAPPAPGLRSPDLLAYPKPKLILAGDLDSVIPIEQLRPLMERMVQPVELEVLQGGDHFLLGYESAIAQRVGGFFANRLGASVVS